MAPFKIEAITRRHHAAPAVRAFQRPSRGFVQVPQSDARAGLPLRGLLYGVPIAVLMWLFLAILWRLA